MSEPIVAPANSGQELQLSDVDNLGAVSGLMDDRVLAEFLHLVPFDGTHVAKAIVTSQNTTGLAQTGQSPILSPAGATGSVNVAPFRAVIGTRNQPAGAPSPNPAVNYQSNALAAYRDIRSAVYTGSASSFSGTQTFAANASGNPRWDLVYAVVAVDANGPSVTRRQKAPSTGVVTTGSVPAYLATTVTIQVVTGTPGASPTPPVLPVDAGGLYNIPIAWVRIPNGFTAGSTIATTDIRSTTADNGGAARSVFVPLQSGIRIEPANGNNDGAATYAANFPWNASAGGRPGPFLPPDFVGGKMLVVEMDFITGGSYSHPSGAIVDNSVDWRNRIFPIVSCQGAVSLKFANDVSGGTTTRLPNGFQLNTFQNTIMASSMVADTILVATGATLTSQTPSNNAAIATSSQVGLYVNMTDGTLRAFVNATNPACRLIFFLVATEQFPNL